MKRLIAFLLLLGLGIVALRFAISDDTVVTASGPQGTVDAPVLGPGVPAHSGKMGATWQTRGAFRYPRVKAVPLPGGGERNEMVFELETVDSEPIGEGVQRLDRVTLTLFDDGVPSATLESRQAFVELGRDSGGRPSVREDKEIDLHDMVLTTQPDSRLAGLRLELALARLSLRDDSVQIYTPNATDPVSLVLDGARRGTLRGKGLQASLPRNRHSTLQRADIDILNEPVLEMAGLVVRARGRLHYTEDTKTGAAELLVVDDVQVDSTQGFDMLGIGLASPDDASIAATSGMKIRGDQLNGWLQRSSRNDPDGKSHGEVVWRLVKLRGSPARVATPGLHFTTPTLAVVPGLTGEPFVVTASGGSSHFEQLLTDEQRKKGVLAMTGSSPRRIQLMRAGEQAAGVHRAYGFPAWTLRQLRDQQLVVLEGAAQLDDSRRSAKASRGMWVHRPHPANDAVLVQGFGDVQIAQKKVRANQHDLRATGNDGFRLFATALRERLDLGPALPDDLDAKGRWRDHRYEVDYGPTTVRGVGGCHVERIGGRSTLDLRAPNDEIVAHFADRDGEVTAVRSLRGELADNLLVSLQLTGVPAVATIPFEGGTITATSPVMEQLSPTGVCLLPPQPDMPAALFAGMPKERALPRLQRNMPAGPNSSGELLATTAPRIELHKVGPRLVFVDAFATPDDPVHASGTIQRKNVATPTAITMQAERLQLLPHAISPASVLAHTGDRSLAAGLPFFAMSQPWAIADGVHHIAIDDEEQGHVEGKSHRLVLSQGAEAGLFLGDPATMTEATVTRTKGDRSVTATGARVRVFRDERLRLQALGAFPGYSTILLPRVVLHQPKESGPLAHISATCRGDIDVLPDEVTFSGPVLANGLLPDNSIDPRGLHIEADGLRMERHAKSGKIARIIGRDVQLLWDELIAHSSHIELDALQHHLLARDQRRARVDLRDGRHLSAEWILVDYETMAVEAGNGLLERRLPAVEVQR